MDASELDYPLPDTAIAQQPIEPRDAARLLVDRGPGPTGGVEHHVVADLPELLRRGDLLVVNDSRVRPARLHLRKPTGGDVELLLLEPVDDAWEALIRPSRRVRARHPAHVAGRCRWQPRFSNRWARVAGVSRSRATSIAPARCRCRPYIHEKLADPERYQTVYARRPVSAAAPTAGLHLTEAVLERCRARGIAIAAIELAVGLDTFRPVTESRVEDHAMHTEAYVVPPETIEACASAERVVAIGTTVVRALETAAASGSQAGRTDLFITRDYRVQRWSTCC